MHQQESLFDPSPYSTGRRPISERSGQDPDSARQQDQITYQEINRLAFAGGDPRTPDELAARDETYAIGSALVRAVLAQRNKVASGE